MSFDKQIDVVIVGAGQAGCACATVLARAGKSVVVVERGSFAGSKNMFGGAVFSNAVEKVYPNFLSNAPIERIISKHNYSLLSDNSAVGISYNNFNAVEESNKAVVVNRAKFDKWCAEQAQEAGAYFAYNTVVRELVQDEKGRIVGIKTDSEVFLAPLVIVADGANSLLAQQIDLRKKFELEDEILSIKEVYEFETQEEVNSRFNLKDAEGLMYEFIGGPLKNKFALGFLYTSKKTISFGLGVSMKDLIKNQQKPYHLLEELKQTPEIKSFLAGAKAIEYSAHLIPESHPHRIPKLYTDGVMLIGDAASLVNNLHFEGTNLALESGILAANTAIEAINKNDFSKKILHNYEKAVLNSYIFKDIKAYRSLMRMLQKNSDTFMGYYMDKANEFFNTFLTVDAIPKKNKYRKFIWNFLKNISPCRLFKDFFNIIKIIFEVLF